MDLGKSSENLSGSASEMQEGRPISSAELPIFSGSRTLGSASSLVLDILEILKVSAYRRLLLNSGARAEKAKSRRLLCKLCQWLESSIFDTIKQVTLAVED